MTKDLDAAKREFWKEVRFRNPDFDSVERAFSPLLDRLIEWSEKQPALKFTWHEGQPGSERQFLVKYCVEGMEDEAAFWAVYPKKNEVAFLIVLADHNPRFPGDLRSDARRELAKMDGRADNPKEYPVVHFGNLKKKGNTDEVLKLMEDWLPRVLPAT